MATVRAIFHGPQAGPIDNATTEPHLNPIGHRSRATGISTAADELTPCHRPCFVAMALAAGTLALACAWLPAAAWLPLAMPPLHARCLAALYAALAFMLARAAQADDIAAVRVPLAAAAAASTGLALAFAAPGVHAAWAVTHGSTAALAVLLLRCDRTLKAPAERLQPALAMAALLGGLLALLLVLGPLLSPAPDVGWWPWPLPARLAPLYAALAATVACTAALLARERRRDARRIGLQTLAVLAAGLLAASAWHWRLLAGGGVSTLLWLLAWALLAALARWRLRH